MLVLHEWTPEPHQCHYLADREAITEYSYAPVLSGAEYESLMDRGYRKFGPIFFRPVCRNCSECRPIRIPVAEFQPTRSQRRAWKAHQHLDVRLGQAVMDAQRLELHDRYQAAQSLRKGWPEKERAPDEYELTFVRSPVPGVEITLWEADLLRAVVITDVTPNVVSGVYHFYDPDLSGGIGTFCMLQTLELARRLEKPWAYFGFYVAGCESLAYKARFRPCEVMGPDGIWRPFAGES
jgi:leucyl-tRNA---protein transferase